MSKMGNELERRLSANHYELYVAAKRTTDKLKAAFAPNPEIDSAEIHVQYLHDVCRSCQDLLDAVICKVEGL